MTGLIFSGRSNECAIERKLPTTFLSHEISDHLLKAFAKGDAAISITFEKPTPHASLSIIAPLRAPPESVTLSGASFTAANLNRFSHQVDLGFSVHRPRASQAPRIDRQEQTTIGS